MPVVAAPAGAPLCGSCRAELAARVAGHAAVLRTLVGELKQAAGQDARRIYERAKVRVALLEGDAQRGAIRCHPEPPELAARLEALWREARERPEPPHDVFVLGDQGPLCEWVEESGRLACRHDFRTLRRPERRGAPRHRVDTPAVLLPCDTRVRFADLSRTGVLVFSPVHRSPGTAVRLSAGGKDGAPVLTGTVRRVRQSGAGGFFLAVQFEKPLQTTARFVSPLSRRAG